MKHVSSSIYKGAVALLVMSSLVGCLQTRSAVKEQEEKQVLKKQVATLQQSTADVSSRFQDLEDDMRKVNGRLEAVENRINQTSAKIEKGDSTVELKFKEQNEKMAAYREEITHLSTELENLKTQMATLQEEQKRAAAVTQQAVKEKEKGPFSIAEEKFEQKNWKEAILDYEKYRKANPKGKQFPEATLKIGIAFQELGQGDVAQAFYEELVAKYPKSKEAGKAKTRLKNLKK